MRGTLCPALKALFEHGLKKPSLLGGACHPWLFIEEVSLWLDHVLHGPVPRSLALQLAGGARGVVRYTDWDPTPLSLTRAPYNLQAAGREVERDFDSVYSRLVLCKTYR